LNEEEEEEEVKKEEEDSQSYEDYDKEPIVDNPLAVNENRVLFVEF